MYTDIHSHVIWGVDDGAEEKEETFRMLKDAVAEIGSGGIASITAVIPGGGVVTIRMGSKLEIKVSRKISRSMTMEATD